MKRAILMLGLITAGLLVGACKSQHEEGVTSDYHAQWTTVMADTAATTMAAKGVLMDDDLKDVVASSTAVDGEAKGKQADGTMVKVSVKKETDTTSDVSVVVGTMGDPKLGAELVKKIKAKAEMH